MRDYKIEVENRVEFIRGALQSAGANGVVFGNSGGKDAALVGILCKMACENTVGIIMPCKAAQNYGSDKSDAEILAAQFEIETRVVDLTATRDEIISSIEGSPKARMGSAGSADPNDGHRNELYNRNLTDSALSNIAPRLRMTTLYAIAASENLLVAGTGNKSERFMGYFTKWGDGAFDFNPVADLTVTEVFEFLRYLGAPAGIIDKAPSAGLFEGQTDEADMGVTYAAIDEYLESGKANDHDRTIIERYHRTSEHKRRLPPMFGG